VSSRRSGRLLISHWAVGCGWPQQCYRVVNPALYESFGSELGHYRVAEKPVQRRLAAILAADVVGYSRLMGLDEAGTLASVRKLRIEVIEPKIAEHQGRLFKTMGDGFLVEFPSVVNAVACAVDIQRSMAARNSDLPEDRALQLRIGVNLGDVVFEGEDVFGDGVNIAARLEGISPAGGLATSAAVRDQIGNRLEVSFVDAGELALKNIDRPIRVFTVAPFLSTRIAPALPDKPSIAVLPFDNMSGDPEQDYFADGMVEEIITALSRMRWLFVIARNSSFAFRGKAFDIKQVARDLGVRYVLEGSVRKSASRIRITGQLIDAATGAHLWADRFDGDLADVFDLQDRVTVSVVGAIAPKLEQAEIARSKRKPTNSLDAYDYYLQGLAGIQRWTREGNDEAFSMFRRAIELDPSFASAYGMAAGCYLWRKSNGWMTNRQQEASDAENLARRALELGKDDPVALCWGGITLAYVVGEAAEGAAFIDEALELDPNFAVAWGFSGWARIWLNEPRTAIEHVARANRLSPLDPLDYLRISAMALANMLLREYAEAAKLAERAVRRQPAYATAHRILTASLALDGKLEEARKAGIALAKADPHFRIADLADRVPVRNTDELATYAEGLRRAGLPE
jgi:TolB-like protein/class 3 adenylate cyclase/tetratricopeptide (TPR) repeat protein